MSRFQTVVSFRCLSGRGRKQEADKISEAHSLASSGAMIFEFKQVFLIIVPNDDFAYRNMFFFRVDHNRHGLQTPFYRILMLWPSPGASEMAHWNPLQHFDSPKSAENKNDEALK